MIDFNLTLLVQIVIFVVFVWLLNRLLYAPVSRMFAERTRRIEEGLAAAERSSAAAAQAQQMIASQLEEARHQAQDILQQAGKSADAMRESLAQEARNEAETIIRRAQAEIQREQQAAIAELRRQVGELAIQAATKIVGQSLDNETNRRLVESAIGEL